jgi:Caenorhabditis protein of unknown function, DUF268
MADLRFKRSLGRLSLALKPWGLEPVRAARRLRAMPVLLRERADYRRGLLGSSTGLAFPMRGSRLIWEDRRAQAGEASGHYFHQDLLVARDVFLRRPRRHVDVGSSIYGFVSHVAAFREIDVIDVRPVTTPVAGIRFFRQDVMNLEADFIECCDSLSCLHALEHFGLGRYGEPLDVDGWKRGLENLARMLEPGGVLYLSVPTSASQRVEFNAHRVFSIPYLRTVIEQDFDILRLAFVTDAGELIEDVCPRGSDANQSFGADYGCSIWFLEKRSSGGSEREERGAGEGGTRGLE